MELTAAARRRSRRLWRRHSARTRLCTGSTTPMKDANPASGAIVTRVAADVVVAAGRAAAVAGPGAVVAGRAGEVGIPEVVAVTPGDAEAAEARVQKSRAW